MSLIGAVLGFFFGVTFFRSYLLGILFSMLGSSLGSRIGLRFFGGNRKNTGSAGWFSGWRFDGTADGSVFTETLFSMLGKLAAADGHVSREEEKNFRNVVINELHITSPQSINTAMEIFHRSSSSSAVSVSEYARRAAETFGNRPQLLEMMLIMMIRVSASSGGIHPEEDKMLREIARIFGYSSAAFDSIRSRYTFGGRSSSSRSSNFDSHLKEDLKEAYSVLDVSEGASESEIRKAYRKKAAEYHPDKIAAKGLPSEFTEFANTKFQEIQKAWDQIRKSRGF